MTIEAVVVVVVHTTSPVLPVGTVAEQVSLAATPPRTESVQRVVVTPVSFVLVTVAVWTVCSVSWIAPAAVWVTSLWAGDAEITPVELMVANVAPEIAYDSTAPGSSSEKYPETSIVVVASSRTAWLGMAVEVGALLSTSATMAEAALRTVVWRPSVSE